MLQKWCIDCLTVSLLWLHACIVGSLALNTWSRFCFICYMFVDTPMGQQKCRLCTALVCIRSSTFWRNLPFWVSKDWTPPYQTVDRECAGPKEKSQAQGQVRQRMTPWSSMGHPALFTSMIRISKSDYNHSFKNFNICNISRSNAFIKFVQKR